MKLYVFICMSLFLILSGCSGGNEPKSTTQSTTSKMERVDDQTDAVRIVEETRETKSSSEKQEESVDVEKLLKDFGDGYANYNSMAERNAKLKKVMTEKCVEMNGINFDSSVGLTSRGTIKQIYQPMDSGKNEYALLLECEQNGSKVRILLLVKVAGSKVSEMTYNTIKQEY